MFCTSCGKEANGESKFCTACGSKVETLKSEAVVTKTEPHWKKVMGGVVGVLVFLMVTSAIRYSTQENLSTSGAGAVSSASVEQSLIEASKEVNKQLPKMVDNDTQLYTTQAQGKDFIYKYKLIGEYETVTQEDIESSVGKSLANMACTTSETRELLNLGVRLIYNYTDDGGNYLGKIIVVLSDCN